MQNWSKQMDGIAGILAVYKKKKKRKTYRAGGSGTNPICVQALVS